MTQSPLEQLKAEIEAEMNVMTAVATGGPRINEVEDEYQGRRKRIRTLLRSLGLEDPNPYVDLWAWYGKWSRDLPSYQTRRTYLRQLFQPLLEAISQLEDRTVGSELPETAATGWAAVDGPVAQLRIRLASCVSAEDAQAVGLLCRDIMISLAEATYDGNTHREASNSAVDQLNAVIEKCAGGHENEALRKLLKSTIDYANVVQHRRGINVAEAGLVAEATVGAVHLIHRAVDLAP